MYSTNPGLILGYHGCDRNVRDEVLNYSRDLQPSNNTYDWLGSGIYFWENSPTRAFEFITDLKENPRPGRPVVNHPTVVGAIISLGHCFDLIDHKNLKILKQGYETLSDIFRTNGMQLPENTGGPDLLLRNLDCLVIKSIHENLASENKFDSVRGMFLEGEALYPNAGFKEKNHIQICIRNPKCIVGYFLPRDFK